jgi:hypothetical protein
MSSRMALVFVCSLALMLQSSQDYPTKPLRLIEPFRAGGGPDLLGRALAQKLAECNGSQSFSWIFSRKFRVLSRSPAGVSFEFSTRFAVVMMG